MSTIDYTALLATVGTLLENKGRSVSVVKKVNTATDPDKPWGASSSADVSVSATGVFTSYTSEEVDEDIVRRGDKKLYLKGDVSQPLDDFDQVVDGSDTWNIVGIRTVQPGDTIMLYVLHVRL